MSMTMISKIIIQLYYVSMTAYIILNNLMFDMLPDTDNAVLGMVIVSMVTIMVMPNLYAIAYLLLDVTKKTQIKIAIIFNILFIFYLIIHTGMGVEYNDVYIMFVFSILALSSALVIDINNTDNKILPRAYKYSVLPLVAVIMYVLNREDVLIVGFEYLVFMCSLAYIEQCVNLKNIKGYGRAYN